MGQHVGTHRFSMSYPRFVVDEAQTGRPTTLWPCLPPLGMIFSLACKGFLCRIAYGSARGNSQIFYELPPVCACGSADGSTHHSLAMFASPRHDFQSSMQVCPFRMAYGSARGNSQILYELPPACACGSARSADGSTHHSLAMFASPRHDFQSSMPSLPF